MNEAVFWALISMLNWDATGNDEAVIAPVVSELSQYSDQEIFEFDNILAQKLYLLDTKAHAQEIGEESYKEGSHFSADWFLYSRCAVIANGEQLYEEVLSTPTSFPDDLEFESLLYIANGAYEMRTGDEYSHVTKVSYETFSNKDGWK